MLGRSRAAPARQLVADADRRRGRQAKRLTLALAAGQARLRRGKDRRTARHPRAKRVPSEGLLAELIRPAFGGRSVRRPMDQALRGRIASLRGSDETCLTFRDQFSAIGCLVHTTPRTTMKQKPIDED
jgi:hypothetical protein